MKHLTDHFFWDAFCISSIIGVWPRFIEPKLLFLSKHRLPIRDLPQEFCDFKIVHLTDLHLNEGVSCNQLNRIVKRVNLEKPDLIAFTGDFICCGKLEEKERLKLFLKSLKSRLGTFAVLGNHDYSGYVSINSQGDYDLIEKKISQVSKGFERLLKTITLSKRVTEAARELPCNEELMSLLKECSIDVLHNDTKQITKKNRSLNITGLGEHMLGRCDAELAFRNYDKGLPGIVLAHNPDAVPQLMKYPGDLILSGHTHGGQINLPFLWKKFSLLENPHLKQGLFNLEDKWVFVSRGLGSVMNFRLFAPPQIGSITLTRAS